MTGDPSPATTSARRTDEAGLDRVGSPDADVAVLPTVGRIGTRPPGAGGSSPATRQRPPGFRRLADAVAGRATHTWHRPGVQHIVAAIDRYNDRMGTQFSAALTYFSFLAIVPILMVAFSVAGFVLSSQPRLLEDLQSDIAAQLPSGLSTNIDDILQTAVDARLTVGIIGLVIALYSGISWMGNLRGAIQAMWRPDFDSGQEIRAENLGRYYWKSLKYLLALGLGILISLGLTTGGSWAQSTVSSWFGLDKVGWLTPLFTVLPIALAVIADVGIFGGLYYVLAPTQFKPSRHPLLRGAIMMAVAFEILKIGFTYVLPLLSKSATAKLFSSVIGLLFFFNAVATAVLFLASWIATTHGEPSAAPPDPPAPRQSAVHAPDGVVSGQSIGHGPHTG